MKKTVYQYELTKEKVTEIAKTISSFGSSKDEAERISKIMHKSHGN